MQLVLISNSYNGAIVLSRIVDRCITQVDEIDNWADLKVKTFVEEYRTGKYAEESDNIAQV